MMNFRNPFEYFQSFANYDAWLKSMQSMWNNNEIAEHIKHTATNVMNIQHNLVEEAQDIAHNSFDSMQKNATELYESIKSTMHEYDYNQALQAQQKYLSNYMQHSMEALKSSFDSSSRSAQEFWEVMKESANKYAPFNKHDKQ